MEIALYLADLNLTTMSNIKVGDRVRALTDGEYPEDICQPGDIGTVKRVDGEVYGVDFDGRGAGPWDMLKWEIELVQPATDLTARIEAIEKRLDAMCANPRPWGCDNVYPAPLRPDYKFGDRVEVSDPSQGRGYSWLPAVIVDNWHGIDTNERKVYVEGRPEPLNLPLSRIRPV